MMITYKDPLKPQDTVADTRFFISEVRGCLHLRQVQHGKNFLATEGIFSDFIAIMGNWHLIVSTFGHN